MVTSPERLEKLFHILDLDASENVSLKEVYHFLKKKYILLSNTQAVQHAFEWATSREGGGNGNKVVEKNELRRLMVSVVYFNRLYVQFVFLLLP